MTPWHTALGAGANSDVPPSAKFVAAPTAKILHGLRCTTYTASGGRTSTAHRSRNVNRPISHDPSGILLSVARRLL